jgi:HlyD family secretion protein
VVVAVALVGFFLLRPLLSPAASIHYVTRPVAYADIAATVSETGIVNPVTQVMVGSEVSGTIRTLTVDFNSKVRKGQVLASLDPTTYQAAVDSTKANIMLAQASADSAVVNVGKMKAQLDMANLTVQRDEPLFTQGLINQNQIDTEKTAAETANQDYLAAQAQVRVAQAQIEVVRGQLKQSQYNLSKTVILSPLDGIVMARNVSVGQTVAASLQTPTLFTIATNLTDMQIDTSVDEADVGSLREKESAEITVTAFPNVVFSGTVLQVRINPTTVQNVVTYDAVVQVHDTSGRLLPGMTAQVTIQVGKKTHALAVPIAAVLYRPLAAAGTGTGGAGPAGGGFGGGPTATSGGAPAALPVAGAPGSKVTIWKLVEGKPAPLQVVIGLSDGKNLEIISGGVQEGDQVIVAQRRGGANAPSPRNGAASGGGTTGGNSASGGSGTTGGNSSAGGGGTTAGNSASGGSGTGGSRGQGSNSSGSAPRQSQ